MLEQRLRREPPQLWQPHLRGLADDGPGDTQGLHMQFWMKRDREIDAGKVARRLVK
jgi:hypothetical protein